MTTKLEALPAPSKKAPAGKPTNSRGPRKIRESPGGLAFSRRARTKALIKHAILIATGGVMIYPLLWMVVSSLRANELIFRDPGLWLNTLEMGNYTDGWSALTHPFGHYMINSAVVVLGSILGNLISCSMAAYAFARLQFTGQKIFFGIMLLTIMLPFHVVIVPQYILFSQIGWVNTFWPLIVPKLLATDAFFVFLMVQFIRGIPRELDEAARIDGAGHPRIFLRVILPLMVPALATTAIFTFIWTWNDFFGALIYLTDPDMFTVPVALRAFVDSQSATSWGSLFAMSIVSLLPVFLVFLFGQRFLIKGIATTGIK
ncbi:carbohydrate ABC transporter permease [Arthrobacter sp. NPDC058097]|uniref:carbohydrate ABC transporter permease n=1 Tax=Arthrobacter sp. NPDC058097 TaxID=3346340 RepID=UPI0036DA46FE